MRHRPRQQYAYVAVISLKKKTKNALYCFEQHLISPLVYTCEISAAALIFSDHSVGFDARSAAAPVCAAAVLCARKGLLLVDLLVFLVS